MSYSRCEYGLSAGGEYRLYIQNSVTQRFGEVPPHFPLPGRPEIFPKRLCRRIGDFTVLVDSAFAPLAVKEEEIFHRLRLEGTWGAPGELRSVILDEAVRGLEHDRFPNSSERAYRSHSCKVFL